jgi:hypothetical protein
MSGVFGMLRSSNLVPGSSSMFEGRKHLRRCDVVFVPRLYALWLTLRETQLLQFSERARHNCDGQQGRAPRSCALVTGSRGSAPGGAQ